MSNNINKVYSDAIKGRYKEAKALNAVNPVAISPKVTWAAIAGAGAVILQALLTAITPDLLEGLGPWAGVVMAGITALAAVVGGYAKGDPARQPTVELSDGAVVPVAEGTIEVEGDTAYQVPVNYDEPEGA